MAKRKTIAVVIARDDFNRMVCQRGAHIESVPLEKALEAMKLVEPDSEIVHAARHWYNLR